MIVFFDKYSEKTKKLLDTLKYLKVNAKVVVLEDNGFLPDEILSPYKYYISRQNRNEHVEKELFYNFLEVPDFWEIRSVGSRGGIFDMGVERAEIYFTEPFEKRIVQRIEWKMENGWVYKIDFYNKYGIKYATEFLDIDKNIDSKVYYSDINQEVIIEQPQNNVVTLVENGQIKGIFTSYADFIKNYVAEYGVAEEYAVFVENEEMLERLDIKTVEKETWGYAWFSNNDLLNRYIGMGGKNGYRFCALSTTVAENRARGEALILTASAQIEKIEELTKEMPDLIFHIAAHTQMSDKLYKLAEERKNVKIYPSISTKDLNDLWDKCDFYLDINHYREIYDAVHEAYQRNLLIMGFGNTLHNKDLLVEECIFSEPEYKKMVMIMTFLINNTVSMRELLLAQQKKGWETWGNFMKQQKKEGDKNSGLHI